MTFKLSTQNGAGELEQVAYCQAGWAAHYVAFEAGGVRAGAWGPSVGVARERALLRLGLVEPVLVVVPVTSFPPRRTAPAA